MKKRVLGARTLCSLVVCGKSPEAQKQQPTGAGCVLCCAVDRRMTMPCDDL